MNNETRTGTPITEITGTTTNYWDLSSDKMVPVCPRLTAVAVVCVSLGLLLWQDVISRRGGPSRSLHRNSY
jgi:hypothetical protein